MLFKPAHRIQFLSHIQARYTVDQYPTEFVQAGLVGGPPSDDSDEPLKRLWQPKKLSLAFELLQSFCESLTPFIRHPASEIDEDQQQEGEEQAEDDGSVGRLVYYSYNVTSFSPLVTVNTSCWRLRAAGHKYSGTKRPAKKENQTRIALDSDDDDDADADADGAEATDSFAAGGAVQAVEPDKHGDEVVTRNTSRIFEKNSEGAFACRPDHLKGPSVWLAANAPM